jgi:hypothetical protein
MPDGAPKQGFVLSTGSSLVFDWLGKLDCTPKTGAVVFPKVLLLGRPQGSSNDGFGLISDWLVKLDCTPNEVKAGVLSFFW